MNMVSWRTAAAERLADAFNRGTPLENLYRMGLDAWAARAMPGLLEGCIEHGIYIVRDLQRRSIVTFRGDAAKILSADFEVDLNMSFARQDYRRVGVLVGILVSALAGAQQTGRAKISLSIPVNQQQIKASEPAKDKPLRVVIEGMPDRVTTTELERNASGEIVSSTQVERDA